MTRFSIVLPCYNAADTLAQTLDSLRAQTCANWEAICVDDGSTDTTADIVADYARRDSRIRLFANSGKGPSDARNHGVLDHARGEVIAFCDADDLWAETKLAVLDRAFEDVNVDALYSQIGFFQTSPKEISTYSTLPARDVSIPMLLAENPVCTMSNLAVRRDSFVFSGGFDSHVVHNEDLEWLIRLVGGGCRLRGVDQPLTYYRANPNGLSADLQAMQKGRQSALKTAARYGFAPTERDQAIYQRYLARRALRLGHGRLDAARFALRGLRHSPSGFFAQPKRGALTLLAALLAVALPAPVRNSLFAH